jgi:acetyl/propionyl-CoA carboxylase alpha subunit
LSVGKVASFRFPTGNGIRIDTHLLTSPQTIVKTDFDSLLAKIIVTASNWEDVVGKAKRALADTEVVGVKTSLPALRGIIASPEFAAQECDTQWLEVSLPLVLDLGAKILRDVPPHNNTILKAKANTDSVAASNSGILFRKGDAWSITLTPASTDLNPSGQGDHPPSHLQLTRVLKNEFPTSLSAAITYTAPSSSPQSYIMEINTTTASAGALASSMKHRRGDNTNPEHVIIPFPGQLMEILVEEGDFIRKGDVVAVVRQMKMELEIRASRGGRVTWTFEGDEGEEVAEGLLVAIIKDTDDGTISAKL